MIVKELLTQCRNTLQDYDKEYWEDSELLNYYNEFESLINYDRDGRKETFTFPLDPSENTYNIEGVIKYISTKDDDDNIRPLSKVPSSLALAIYIKNYNEIYVNDPTVGNNITLDYVGIGDPSNMEDIVRLGDDLCAKYFILSRAYEKETDTEDFDKSDRFFSKFVEQKDKLLGKNSIGVVEDEVLTTKIYNF